MLTSSTIGVQSNQVLATQKARNTSSVTDKQKNETVKQTAPPSAPKTTPAYNVNISSQAQTLLANSKDYSPTEEANELGYEKAFEKSMGQR